MILLRRLIPFIAPITLCVIYVGLWIAPLEWRWWVGASLATAIFSLMFLMQWRWRTKEYWALLFPLLGFLIGGTGVLLFLNSVWYQLLLVALMAILSGVYLENIFIFFYQPQRYSHLSIPNISFVLLILSLFTLFTAGFAMQFVGLLSRWLLLLNLPGQLASLISQGSLTLIGFLLGAAVMTHMLWSYKLMSPAHRSVIWLFGLVCAELLWVLQLLPTAYFVNGMFATILCYGTLACLQLHLRQILTRQLIAQYVVISLVAIAIVFATSQWR